MPYSHLSLSNSIQRASSEGVTSNQLDCKVQLAFGDQGKGLLGEAVAGVVVVVVYFHFNKLCLKNKGGLHLLSKPGWRVVCFLETLKSVLSQQD